MERTGPQTWEVDAVLSDGHTVRLRSIRPDDVELIRQFHSRQSSESIYFRFFSPRPKLSDRQLQHFTSVDHVDRVAFVALTDGEVVAVARYERYEGTDTAEVAFFVDDRHHGRGLATLMLEYLAAAAVENGIGRFRATTLPNNRRMLGVFAAAGYEVATQLDDGVVDVAFDLRPTDAVAAAVDRRERSAEAASVRRLLRPSSIVVVDSPCRAGPEGQGGAPTAGAVADRLTGAGFTGEVRVASVDGLAALPEGTDLVVIPGPATGVAAVLEACGRRAVGAAVVSGPADEHDTRAILDAARRHGLRILGPASAGVINTDPTVLLHTMPEVPVPPTGRISILADSDDVVGAIVDHADRVGLGLSSLVSVGTPVDLGVPEMLSYWADDDRTAAVLLHLGPEVLSGRFVRAARVASMSKPVVALRATSAARGPRRDLVPRRDEAALRQSGVIVVQGLQELFAIGRLLADQPPPSGRGVALIGTSEGAAQLGAAACRAAGLDVRLQSVPTLDLHGFAAAVDASVADPAVSSLLVVDAAPGSSLPPDLRDAVLRASAERPSLTVAATTVGGERPTRLSSTDPAVAVPVFTFPEHAATAIGRLASAGEWQRTARVYGVERPVGDATEVVRSLLAAWLAEAERPGGSFSLGHPQQEELFTAIGIDVAPRRDVATIEEAVAAAEEVGWPVVLKARLRDRSRRTALGGVALDVADEAELRRTWARMEGAVGARAMAPAVVQRMVERGVDVAVRVHRDGQVATVEVGVGGPASAFDRMELGVLPLALADAGMLVSSSSVARAMTDPLDRVPVVALVHRLAVLLEQVDDIDSVVVDPAVVSGPTAWITDAEVVVGARTADPPVRHLE